MYTAADGDEAAAFLCYGVFDEMGDIVPFEADTVAVTLYDAQEEGEALGTADAVYDEEAGGWAFEVPLPEENTVYWASFDGSLTSPVYIVVDEAETTQTLYNAMTSAYAHLSEAGEAAAASLPEASCPCATRPSITAISISIPPALTPPT
ncbi:MAG: hypothetical protein LUC89_04515 [Oscillospiraceae bacterium]|nr:hypothetical protein [Oscillospiraceae bacterium]